MSYLNRVDLIGNLGSDPEIRYTQDGKQVANFSIATTERWNDQQGNQQERTEWHRIVLWQRNAEIAGQYLKKGKKVFISGRLQSRKYTDNNQIERTVVEIVGQVMKLLSPSENGQPGNQGTQTQAPANQQQQQQQQHQQPANGGAAPAQAPQGGATAPAGGDQNWDPADGELPF